MTKTYTLTEEQLEELINERMKYKPITPQGLFNPVAFEGDELLEINQKYPEVVSRLSSNWRVPSVNPIGFIYTNKPHYNEVMNETSYHTLTLGQVHNSVRSLVLNVFGKSNNRDLTIEEYEMAQELYTELKDWYIRSYDRRLEVLEN
ncbi:TPA: hypothetical protein U1C38_000382 [Streptococcus suis]|nr:hypothetical protein [Streptococcus suis]